MIIRSDRGGEFNSEVFNDWATRRGYQFKRTAPYTPKHNGLAERFNGVLIEAVRAIMEYHNVPKTWWEFAVTHANDVINMLPVKILDNKSPNFIWSGKDQMYQN